MPPALFPLHTAQNFVLDFCNTVLTLYIWGEIPRLDRRTKESETMSDLRHSNMSGGHRGTAQWSTKLAAGRMAARRMWPYFGAALPRMTYVPAPGIGTMATTYDGIVFYDPEVFERWSANELGTVILHEYMHIYLGHFKRAKALGLIADDFTPCPGVTPDMLRDWNIACDAEINWKLDRAWSLPGEAIVPATIGCEAGQLAEGMYLKLRKDAEAQAANDEGGPTPGDPQDGEGSPGEYSPAGDETTDSGEETTDAAAGGSGGEPGDSGGGGGDAESGEDSTPGGGGSGGQPQAQSTPGTADNPAGCGSAAGVPMPKDLQDLVDDIREGGGGMSDAAADRLRSQTDQAIDQAIDQNHAGNRQSAGHAANVNMRRFPKKEGGKCRFAAPSGEANGEWLRMLTQVIESQVNSRRRGHSAYTYGKMSRRQASYGYGAGKPRMPAMVQNEPDIVVAIDTSGSVSQAQIAKMLEEIQAMMRLINVRKGIRVIACDYTIKGDVVVRDIREAEGHVRGGGGTDLRPPFRKLAEENVRPDCLVYFTDGYGPAPDSDPGFPVVWALCGSDYYIQNPEQGSASPYGREVRIGGAL